MEVSVTNWTWGGVVDILWTISVFFMMFYNHRRITKLEAKRWI